MITFACEDCGRMFEPNGHGAQWKLDDVDRPTCAGFSAIDGARCEARRINRALVREALTNLLEVERVLVTRSHSRDQEAVELLNIKKRREAALLEYIDHLIEVDVLHRTYKLSKGTYRG